MKKMSYLLLLVFSLTLFSSAVAQGSNNLEGATVRFFIGKSNYFINEQTLSMDTVPVIKEGRTFVPLRFAAEAIGAEVKWEPSVQNISIRLQDTTVELWVGENTALVNGEYQEIEPGNPNVTPVIVAPGRTIVPLRFISESLGGKVLWCGERQEVTLLYPAPEEITFNIYFQDKKLELLQWDSEVDPVDLLGKPQKEEIVRLGQEADTYAGSYVKTLTYEGITLKLFSPKDNGTTFWLYEIEVAAPGYLTSRNIQVGNKLEDLLKAFPELQVVPTDNDLNIYRYTDEQGLYSYLEFYVRDEVVKTIRIYHLFP